MASARHDAVPAVAERLPVAGSTPEAAPGAPPVDEQGAGARHAASPEPPRSEAPPWSQVAAAAQASTVAVRADQSYGAGVAVEAAGYVLTNLHVVDGAKSIGVTPFGADSLNAEVVDSDRELDLALLRVPGPLQHTAQIGHSKSLGVGDEVLAVGSPRKMYFSVSRGMVSFPNRFLDGVEYVQTDLPINVGNSGGPLVDRDGKVVGVVSFILRDSQGISFALPIDRAVARFGAHLKALAEAGQVPAGQDMSESAAAAASRPAP